MPEKPKAQDLHQRFDASSWWYSPRHSPEWWVEMTRRIPRGVQPSGRLLIVWNHDCNCMHGFPYK